MESSGDIGVSSDAGIFTVFNDEPLYAFLVDKLSGVCARPRSFRVLRLLYTHYIFEKVNSVCPDQEITGDFMDRMRAHVYRSDVRPYGDPDCDYSVVVEALGRLPYSEQLLLFKSLEKLSRGQSGNPLWHMLRADTVSATKFYQALVTGALVTSVPADDRRAACGVRFGIDHEGVVKALVECYVAKDREPIRGGLGLLIDPESGLLGASIDVCFGVGDRSEDELLHIGSGAVIMEIKCRYKYLRDGDDPSVMRVRRDANADAVIRFVLGHPVPGVEYRAENEIPTGNDFLLSRDERFRGDKKRRQGRSPDILRSYIHNLVRINQDCVSEVIVFDTRAAWADAVSEGMVKGGDRSGDRDVECGVERHEDATCKGDQGSCENDPDDDDLTPDLLEEIHVYEKARFSLPVFVNPRHQYYFQTLLQHYVLSQYYINDHSNPERIGTSDLPTAHIVSAVLRRRDRDEVGKKLVVGDRRFGCENVPLFIIVTPVVFDPDFARDAINTVTNNWQRHARRNTGLDQLWVPNAVNEYVASLVPRPRTP